MWENNQRGHSLIEVMISVGLLAMVFYGVVGMCTRQHADTVQRSARTTAQKDVDQVINTIKRDMKYLSNNGFTVTGQGTGVQIQRMSPNQNNPAVTYTVRFQSVCMAMTPEQNDYNQAYSDPFRTTLYAAPQTCLPRLNCPQGTYPGVQITTQGTNPLAYQPSFVPTLTKSLLGGSSGLALCVQVQSDQITFRTESVIMQGKPGAYTPQVISKVVSVPLQSSSGLVLVPN